MKNLSVAFVFKKIDFKNAFIGFVIGNFRIKSFRINRDFEWRIAELNEILEEVEYDQLEFYFNNGGKLIIQNLKNNLPRIYCSEVDTCIINTCKDHILKNYSNIIIYGNINDRLDNILQNNEELDCWLLYGKPIPPYAQIFPNPLHKEGKPGMDMIAKEFISIESLPGHSHIMNYSDMLWFGSCWQMYFSPIYYKYIPKPLFDDFKDCYENVVLENDLRRVTLFEDVNNYDLPKNRARQWAFRRQLGIDSIAHELTRQNNRIEPKDLPVIITKQNCVKGTTRVIRFLDFKNSLVFPSQAFKMEIKEYLDDGVTVVYEKIEVIP